MFAFLRKLIFPIIIVVLFFFVAMIILQWGADITRSGRPEDSVGEINGQNITINEYDGYYTRLLRQEQENVEGDLPSEKTEEIRNTAWSQLVADHLINKEIEKFNIYVTPEEIYTFLKMYPPKEVQKFSQFMTDGKFDYQKYVNAMVAPENAPFWAQIEAYVLPDLKKYKLQEMILSTVRVTPAEVMDAFMAENEKVKIGYINCNSSLLESIAPEPTEEEIKTYYDSHKEEEFKLLKRASINLISLEKVPSDNDWAEVKYLIDDIYDSVKTGADFAEIARTYSEDNSAQNGGDLGWFAKGRMVPAFDSAVFAMKVDQISPPIRTRFGWHIIKLTGIKTEKETPRGKDKPEMVEKRQASHILLKVKASQATIDQMFANAQDFVESAKEIGFEEAAKEYNYEFKETAPFVEGGYIQYIGQNVEANEFAFKNGPGAVGNAIETQNAFFIYSVARHFPEDYTSLEDASKSIRSKLKKENAAKVASDTATVIYDDIMAGMTFKKAGDKYGFGGYQTTGLITRDAVIPGVGRVPEIAGTAFSLKGINAISPPIDYERGSIILTLLEHEAPNIEQYNEIQDSLRYAVLQKKHQDVYNRWYTNLIDSAKIVKDIDRFYRNY